MSLCKIMGIFVHQLLIHKEITILVCTCNYVSFTNSCLFGYILAKTQICHSAAAALKLIAVSLFVKISFELIFLVNEYLMLFCSLSI